MAALLITELWRRKGLHRSAALSLLVQKAFQLHRCVHQTSGFRFVVGLTSGRRREDGRALERLPALDSSPFDLWRPKAARNALSERCLVAAVRLPSRHKLSARRRRCLIYQGAPAAVLSVSRPGRRLVVCATAVICPPEPKLLLFYQTLLLIFTS